MNTGVCDAQGQARDAECPHPDDRLAYEGEQLIHQLRDALRRLDREHRRRPNARLRDVIRILEDVLQST